MRWLAGFMIGGNLLEQCSAYRASILFYHIGIRLHLISPENLQASNEPTSRHTDAPKFHLFYPLRYPFSLCYTL
ncbi:hypothetical protein F4804DRAFT_102301 [Jackrogersella minutella]|nr:hypothetical protein F4804DRAFT_102301 [Jackrogersella minutella]